MVSSPGWLLLIASALQCLQDSRQAFVASQQMKIGASAKSVRTVHGGLVKVEQPTIVLYAVTAFFFNVRYIDSILCPASLAAKEAMLRAHDTTREVGLEFERKLFFTLFTTKDSNEGMHAFLEKRKTVFKGE